MAWAEADRALIRGKAGKGRWGVARRTIRKEKPQGRSALGTWWWGMTGRQAFSFSPVRVGAGFEVKVLGGAPMGRAVVRSRTNPLTRAETMGPFRTAAAFLGCSEPWRLLAVRL